MEQTKNFEAMENSASRNALQILRYMLTGVFKEWFSCYYYNILTRKGCSDGGHCPTYFLLHDQWHYHGSWYRILSLIRISLHAVHMTESQAIQMYNNFQQNKLLANALQKCFTQYFMNLKPWKFSLAKLTLLQ